MEGDAEEEAPESAGALSGEAHLSPVGGFDLQGIRVGVDLCGRHRAVGLARGANNTEVVSSNLPSTSIYINITIIVSSSC